MSTTTSTRPAALAVTFRVAGTPTPQGSKRIGRHGSRPVILDAKDGALKEWRARVAVAAHNALHGRAPIDGPVAVQVEFFLQRPASHYGAADKLRSSAPALPAVKPDLDKLVRSLGDAISQGATRIITEDSRIVEWHARKFYGPPGARVTVSRLAPASAEGADA